ncbi:MAG: hypothetical protein WC548_00520 [Candidatus Pacearchaeota archaeon]
MKFEIDVSGEDLLSKGYVICVANSDSIIKGFKFTEELVNILCSKYGQEIYRYKKSKKEKTNFKIRLYSIVIYNLFKSINFQREISLKICRDFPGKEKEIKENLKLFLEKILNLNLGDRIYFEKLSPESNAHKYAYMMRIDSKNKMNTYIKLNLDDFERWLK